MERYRILIWIGVIHHDTFRFPGAIKIEILKRRFYRFFLKYLGKDNNFKNGYLFILINMLQKQWMRSGIRLSCERLKSPHFSLYGLYLPEMILKLIRNLM